MMQLVKVISIPSGMRLSVEKRTPTIPPHSVGMRLSVVLGLHPYGMQMIFWGTLFLPRDASLRDADH